jgi:hypothetical protein
MVYYTPKHKSVGLRLKRSEYQSDNAHYNLATGRSTSMLVVADDSPEHLIKQADYDDLEEAIAALPDNGGDIYLAYGTHDYNTVALPAKTINFRGAGIGATTIRLNDDVDYLFDIATVTYGGFHNLTLDGNKAARSSGSAFHGRPYKYVFRDVELINFADHGIYFENAGAGGDTETTIERCIFWGIDGNAIYSDLTNPCSGVHVQRTWFQENNLDVVIRGQWWSLENGCVFSGTTGGTSIHIYNDSSHFSLTDFRAQDCQYGLLYIPLAASDMQSLTVANGRVEECNAGDNGGQKIIEVTKTTGTLKHINIHDIILDDSNSHNAFANFFSGAGVDDLIIHDNDVIGATIDTPVSHDATTYRIHDNLGIADASGDA